MLPRVMLYVTCPGLFGPTADIEQQIASQYFTMFTLPNSSSIRGEFW